MLWRMLISQNENTAPLWQRGTQPRAWHTFLRVELLMIIYSTQETLMTKIVELLYHLTEAFCLAAFDIKHSK